DGVSALFDAVTALQVRLGGTPSGEHGDGRLRAGLLERVFGAQVMALFRQVKRAYDPGEVLNPGVILPAADWAPLVDLKVGAAADYLENIKKQGHGSVLEHSVYVLLIEGISRSCSHELVRHRAGFGYSQISQRYVDESHAAFVVPPAVLGDPKLEAEWTKQVAEAQAAYVRAVEGLMERYTWIADKVHRRKMAREAARSVLPNATEVKIVVSGNARAWRTTLELRCGEGAELEIRRMAVACLGILQREAPA